MYQLKLFEGDGSYRKGNIEKEANKWLQEQGEKIEVVSITQSASEFVHVLTILYKPKKKGRLTSK